MIISRLELKNFRSHSSEVFEFKPEVNTIIGPNGSGKTNLLEALYLICVNQTFRAHDQKFIEYGKKSALIKSYSQHEERELKLTSRGDETTISKEFRINTKKIYRLTQQQRVPICLFEPNHLQVVYGGPDLRRNMVDNFLMSISLEYQKSLKNYKRALTQRNNLLKSERRVSDDELFIWNVRLSEYGNILVSQRRTWVDYCNHIFSGKYRELSGEKEDIQIVYKHAYDKKDYGTWLLAKLQANNDRDKLIGFTTSGPHRDDFEFRLDDQPAESTASRGEIRSIILTYKMLEAQFMEEKLDQKPIVMLDDVFSELDKDRQNNLLDLLSQNQTFITTTHKN